MASGKILGKEKIQEGLELNDQIKKIYEGEMRDGSDNLYRIVDNLVEWADETIIGRGTREKLSDIIKELNRLMNHTKDLHNDMETFFKTQADINKGIY